MLLEAQTWVGVFQLKFAPSSLSDSIRTLPGVTLSSYQVHPPTGSRLRGLNEGGESLRTLCATTLEHVTISIVVVVMVVGWGVGGGGVTRRMCGEE